MPEAIGYNELLFVGAVINKWIGLHVEYVKVECEVAGGEEKGNKMHLKARLI